MRRVILPEVIIRKYLVWVLVCGLLMLIDWRINMAELTGPAEKGIFTVESVVDRAVKATAKPVEVVWYWNQGLRRIADLEQRVSDLVIDKVRLEQLEQDVVGLRSIADVEVVKERDKVMTKIIKTKDGVVLGVGVRDEIVGGEIVVDKKGVLIGIIDEVGMYTSSLIGPEEIDHRMGVELAGKTINGVMVGDGGGVELQELLQEAEVTVGDVVVTSGADGRYPNGIIVAQIREVESLSSAVTKTAKAELLRDLEGAVFVYK